MPRDMSIISGCYAIATSEWWRVWQWGHICTYRRGVCVARFDKLGNARAFES